MRLRRIPEPYRGGLEERQRHRASNEDGRDEHRDANGHAQPSNVGSGLAGSFDEHNGRRDRYYRGPDGYQASANGYRVAAGAGRNRSTGADSDAHPTDARSYPADSNPNGRGAELFSLIPDRLHPAATARSRLRRYPLQALPGAPAGPAQVRLRQGRHRLRILSARCSRK